MNFKAQMQKDIKETFLNMGEFADLHTVKYGGNCYKVPLVLDSFVEEERKILSADYGEGVQQTDIVAYISLNDLGLVPQKDVSVTLDGEKDTIQKVDNEYGMIVLYLRRYGE